MLAYAVFDNLHQLGLDQLEITIFPKNSEYIFKHLLLNITRLLLIPAVKGYVSNEYILTEHTQLAITTLQSTSGVIKK